MQLVEFISKHFPIYTLYMYVLYCVQYLLIILKNEWNVDFIIKRLLNFS